MIALLEILPEQCLSCCFLIQDSCNHISQAQRYCPSLLNKKEKGGKGERRMPGRGFLRHWRTCYRRVGVAPCAGEVSCAGSGLPWWRGGPIASAASALCRCSPGLLLRAISLHSTQTSTSRVWCQHSKNCLPSSRFENSQVLFLNQ